MATPARLLRSFPGPALEMADMPSSPAFLKELANFLSEIDVTNVGSAPSTTKAGSTVFEVRDTSDPHYVTQLLTSILHGSPGSKPADVPRIEKRVRNDVLWDRTYAPWRRSPLWLIIRVALQSALQRATSDGRKEYKTFLIFLLTDVVLSVDECDAFTTDELVCIQNKIARRLKKLDSDASPGLILRATQAISKARKVVKNRWDRIRSQQAVSPTWSPRNLDTSGDTNISLLSSKAYIYSRLERSAVPACNQPVFKPSEAVRLNDNDFLIPGNIAQALSRDPYIALADVEEFAINRLEEWVDMHRRNPSVCVVFATCITCYATAAREQYKDNPENQSLMLLTVFLLWSALDQLAISKHPLLADYSPEIPEKILDPLLLRHAHAIASLIRLRKYLRTRHCNAHGSVFSDKLSSSSFAIRFFHDNISLKRLKEEIEAEANAERESKRIEFARMKEQHRELISRARSMEHSSLCGKRKKACERCKVERRAKKMRIAVHEWPLPNDTLTAQATVFELKCPPEFQSWRATTYAILYDFCRPEKGITGTTPEVKMKLPKYPALKRHKGPDSRIIYASHTKSFVQSHYSHQRIEDVDHNLTSILVNNGLSYSLFDTVHGRWVKNSFSDCTIESVCMFQLQRSSSYYALRYAMQAVTHSANRSLAEQMYVPPELGLHEHIAFGTLRCGPLLQWLNLLRELRVRTLSFDRFEVHLLFTHTALHTGDMANVDLLEWHQLLRRGDFALALLAEADDLLLSVENNWHHVFTLQTVIILVTRLLACSANLGDDVIIRACSTLRSARLIAFSWVSSLIAEQNADSDEAASDVLCHRVCAAAATCRATYDVDAPHFDRLITSQEDVSIFIQCAIHLCDNTPSSTTVVGTHELNLLLARDRRLARRIGPTVWNRVQRSREGIDLAMHAIWSDYQHGLEWTRLSTPNERWLTTTTSRISNSAAQSLIHYNLFAGTLLIDGKPLGRLPDSITFHPTYVRLLGQKILHVIPSTLPSMQFATRKANFASEPNLSLHFRLPEPDGNLIIQAKCGDDIFEHIPHTVFGQKEGKDFPSSFIEDYAHWLHVTTSKTVGIGFHPLNLIWKPSEENWHLFFNSDIGTGMMRDRNGSLMVDVRSPSFTTISKRLGVIDCSDYLHTILDLAKGGTLVAKLTRFRLEFFLNGDQELECSTIRNMIVDPNQSTGTMFGLANQLVLRNKCRRITRIGPSESRCCVIPFGKVHFKSSMHHALVEIKLNDSPSQKYFVYQIDTTLGRLIGPTLLSDVYKVYLHACTSFPLPDDLTGRTGTEEALCELESARYFSFQDLTMEEVALFHDIANLTPVVEWYPKHLKVMHTIHWSNLGPLSQHWAFASRVNDVLQFHKKLHSIGITTSGDSLSQSTVDIRRDEHLLGRLDSRTFGLYAPGRNPPLSYSDLAYSADDSVPGHRCRPTQKTVTLTSDVSAFPHHMTKTFNTMQNLWERLCTIQILNDESSFQSEIFSYPDLFSHNLSDLFLPLYKACLQERRPNEVVFKIAFALSTMVYTASSSENVDQILSFVPTIFAFACLPQFKSINLPTAEHYDLALGVHPNRVTLSALLERHKLQPPANQPSQLVGESDRDYRIRRDKHWKTVTLQQIQTVINDLEGQWPCKAPSIPCSLHSLDLLDMASKALKEDLSRLFNNWYNNRSLQLFIDRVQIVLDEVHVPLNPSIPQTKDPYQVPDISHKVSSCHRHYLHLRDMCFNREPKPPPPSSSTIPGLGSVYKVHDDSSMIPPNDGRFRRVDTLVEQFSASSDVLHRVYVKDLETSLQCYYREISTSISSVPQMPPQLLLNDDFELARRKFIEAYEALVVTLLPTNPLESALSQAGQWPILTIRTFLGLLSTDLNCTATPLSLAWHNALVTLAQKLIKLQRARRVLLFKISGRDEALSKELNNVDFETNISFNNPEWLLIQIDSDFTVRPVQSSIAQEMISPSSRNNVLTQLNMGEGKSAVIVPLISSSLADGDKLVRVVTLKPLIKQMFDLLVRRLSGLANRRIFYLPFSRDFKADPEHLRQLWALYEECLHGRGILLLQPEHILSFRLMGIDMAGGTGSQAAEVLLQCHRWLTSVSRDIFDESDEILKVNYQLVYTSGVQQSMDGHPDRWTIVQEVIGYVQNHANALHHDPKYAYGLEVHRTEKIGCPIIRILNPKAGEDLMNRVVQEVMSNDRLKLLPQHIHAAVLNFITCRDGSVGEDTMDLRSSLGSGVWSNLLIYRGLLGRGLLRFVLQEKRWRVEYGLDTSRTLLAVPYRAKDLPSPRADFGHPDVALLLTCLSYYYGGLSENQLDECFELLFKLDDPAMEYNQWVFHRDEIPTSFRDIKNINLDDGQQRDTILGPLFRKNKTTIDFYLSNVVFPRYAKQFPTRLSTSSWDLAAVKDQVTTGFSGTNDNRYLLPTSIEQSEASIDHDAFGQRATNAKVLDILLREENDRYCCIEGSDGQTATGSDFLQFLVEQNPQIRVLLDVGAQMLDMQSTQLVSRWLSLVPVLHAIVFFDDADELVIMSRDQRIERFASSQYSQQLDVCAVYLDDAHTRGTDIKMPTSFRAAVTLGPKLTKDRLVQGCMRMRQLGRGQSVMFFASKEVDRSIRACKLAPLEASAPISSADILRWTICQTCEDIQRYLPQWAQQGVNYQRRNDAWALYERNPSAISALQTLRSSWEEPDAETLDEMYNMQPNGETAFHPAFQLPHLRKRLEDIGISTIDASRADEEQEREVSREAEKERQRELPPKVEPASSTLHKSVILLVQSGNFETSSPAFIPLFSPMKTKHPWSTALFSTKDFATTIQNKVSTGDFFRPVNWILSVPQRRALVVISPFEANELLPKIWTSKHVHLHIYSPRVNMNMKSMEDLKMFSIPPVPASSDALAFVPNLMLELNLWAGQLYLKDFDTYQQLCRTLGLVGDEAGALTCDSDGFVKPEDRTGSMKDECKMVVSPVPFLKELFSFRRKGIGFASTHMGKLLAGRPLDPKDF
ncbi:hypothetical protein H0H92_013869 [Tricholoma furcatifolium]|nr:hypothetical protein H0H92_013869 [Tricholoma furcatifolium]